MPKASLLHTTAYFQREGSGSSRTEKPGTWNDSHGIGVVVEVEHRIMRENEVFDKPIGGKWVDYNVIPNRDREEFTLTMSELSLLFWQLLRGTAATSGSYTPGAVAIARGWLKVQTHDQDSYAGTPLDVIDRWCHLDIETFTVPKTGIVQARIVGRKLYSTLNVGSFGTIT